MGFEVEHQVDELFFAHSSDLVVRDGQTELLHQRVLDFEYFSRTVEDVWVDLLFVEEDLAVDCCFEEVFLLLLC